MMGMEHVRMGKVKCSQGIQNVVTGNVEWSLYEKGMKLVKSRNEQVGMCNGACKNVDC